MRVARRAIAVLAAMGLGCLHRPAPAEPPREPAPAAAPPAARPPPPEPAPGEEQQTVPPKPAKPPPKKPEPSKSPAAKAAPGAIATRWKAEGCLTARSKEEAMQFSRQPRSGEAGPPVSFERSRGGVVVVHRLAHACCLSAKVDARVEGGRYVVIERLSGKACGCLCDSTLRTTLSAPAGKHAISVEVHVLGLSKHAYEGTFEVR
jgi:hypothetical protein